MIEYLQKLWPSERLAIDTLSNYNIRQKVLRTYIIQYTGKHPDSYVSLWEIAENLGHGYDEPINQAFAGLNQNIKTPFTGMRVTGDLRHMGPTAIGRSFPAIRIIDQSGKNQKISYPSLQAKYVLLYFWFGLCRSCLTQFPEYIKIVNEYRSKGFILIGISSDATAANVATWKEVIQSNSLNWDQYRTDDVSLKNLYINTLN